MRMPNTKQLKESPRNHLTGIPTAGPVIPQTTPKSTEAMPENGTITPYFIGFSARIMKNTPIPTQIADVTLFAFVATGGPESDSIPKSLVNDSNVEIGRNIPNTHGRHKIPVIHRLIFNPRICVSFQMIFPFNISAIKLYNIQMAVEV
jgi:hypothetical protein